MKYSIADKGLAAIIKDIQRQTDRGAAIVGSAFLESYLESAIIARMRPLSPKTRELLFEGTGALSTFSAKIHIGFALGLYNENSYSDLRIINKIRNIFAHAPEPKTFGAIEIASRCKTLYSRNYVFDPRKFGSTKRARKDYQNAIFFYMTILKGIADQPSANPTAAENPRPASPPSSPAKFRVRPHPPNPRGGGSGTK